MLQQYGKEFNCKVGLIMMDKDNFNYYNDLFRDLRDKKIGSFLILIKLYKGQYLNLCWAILFFVIKHSPVWAIPVVTAQMVNIVSDPENNDLTWLWINLAII